MKTSTLLITIASGIIVAGAVYFIAQSLENEDLDDLYFNDNEKEKGDLSEKNNTKNYNTDNLFV